MIIINYLKFASLHLIYVIIWWRNKQKKETHLQIKLRYTKVAINVALIYRVNGIMFITWNRRHELIMFHIKWLFFWLNRTYSNKECPDESLTYNMCLVSILFCRLLNKSFRVIRLHKIRVSLHIYMLISCPSKSIITLFSSLSLEIFLI